MPVDPGPLWLIPESRSWMDYTSAIEFVMESGAVLHRPLGNPNTGASSSSFSSSLLNGLRTIFDGGYEKTNGIQIPPMQGKVPAAVVQYPTAGVVSIRLVGNATRAGYRIRPPSLVSILGVTPVWIKTVFRERVLGNTDIPVYAASWEVYYDMPSAPAGTLPPPPDTILGGDSPSFK